MNKLVFALLLCCSFNAFTANDTKDCSSWFSLFKPVCLRLHQIWDEGDNELYLSGYAWHNRYVYSAEKIRSYNERAWGGGLGKSLFDEKGNWHGLYAFAFLDSHSQLEPTAGYAYLKVATINQDIKAGIGYSVLVTSRADINNRIPFPGAVPWASLFIGKATFAATYIPGNSNNGNVLYMLIKYRF